MALAGLHWQHYRDIQTALLSGIQFGGKNKRAIIRKAVADTTKNVIAAKRDTSINN
jgi:hypothetical protein